MRTETDIGRVLAARLEIANVRIFRLAFGTAACLWFSQAVAWDLSFIAAVMTMLILAQPIPAPKLKTGVGLIALLLIAMLAGLFLLPRILNQPMVGLLLLLLALYWSFYFTAKGGSPLVGTLLTIGIALTAAVGTVSVDALLIVMKGVIFGTVVGLVFASIAHLVFPDSLAGPLPAAAAVSPAPKPDPVDARWNAFRSLVIVAPIALFFLMSSASSAYLPVMIKTASMGQQASNEATKVAGRSLIMSTLIGGIGAVIGWQMLSIAPSLTLYTLAVGLAGLVAGPRIFESRGLHADAATWSYAYLTMIVILAPAVMDGIGGAAAGAKFVDRLVMFLLTTLYAVVAVYVFDAFRPGLHHDTSPSESASGS